MNIEKALKSVIKYNELREWMNKPFTIGKNVYATDAHTIIKVPKSIVCIFDKLENDRNEKAIIGFFDLKHTFILDIKISELKDIISKIPLVDECINAYATGKCNECYGEGMVEWEYEGYYKDMDCPVCFGDGKIKESRKEKTGRKIKAEGYYVDINTSRLRTAMIEQLITISEHLEVDKIDVIHKTSPNQGVVFKIGIAEVIMMPILITDEKNILHQFRSLSEKAVEKNC